jgi:hypothetical protein
MRGAWQHDQLYGESLFNCFQLKLATPLKSFRRVGTGGRGDNPAIELLFFKISVEEFYTPKVPSRGQSYD